MRYLILVLALAACGGTEPSAPTPKPDSGFERVVGEWCETPGATVTRDGSNATVELKLNRTEHREVTDANGFRREQEVRSCFEPTCVFRNATGFSDDFLIQRCIEFSTS